jgi:hypothetical protein
MAVARSLFVSASCSALVLAALLVPVASHADSNGVPPIGGVWSGTFSDVYWDQTSAGSVKPKQKFKSKVDVTIAQSVDAFTITINFQDPFFVDSAVGISTLVLDGFGGNYHANAAMNGAISVTLSGVTNKGGTKLTFTGVGASSEFTHEVTIKLKKTAAAT